tara:strand:+ start:1927 stop:2190 length:264 start_codon:yes stop_codon:yes gene_type:complete
MSKRKHSDIISERHETHGNAHDTFTFASHLITDLFIAKQDLYISPHEFALINILHKISRIVNGSYHPDHWDDIVGYALLGKEEHKNN